MAAAGDLLWVGDSGNDRVLQWNHVDAVDGADARLVVGQLSVDTHDPGPSDVLIGRAPEPNFVRVFASNTKLLVSDSVNARVLVWNRLPLGDAVPASLVLGQPAFDASESHLGADGLMSPSGIWTNGAEVVVCDRNAHRVLIWNHFPLNDAEPADVVLGQEGFDTADRLDPPSATSLANPSAVFFDGERLFVVDGGNNRVLVWNGMPAANGQAADVVIGQPNFDTGLPNVDGSATARPDGLRGPSSVLVAFGSLFVAESANSRVLVFTPVPEVNGASASAVLGQTDLVSNAGHDPAADTMFRPSGLAVAGRSLFVADREWNRVVRYRLDP